jgi:hypothetical protein
VHEFDPGLRGKKHARLNRICSPSDPPYKPWDLSTYLVERIPQVRNSPSTWRTASLLERTQRHHFRKPRICFTLFAGLFLQGEKPHSLPRKRHPFRSSYNLPYLNRDRSISSQREPQVRSPLRLEPVLRANRRIDAVSIHQTGPLWTASERIVFDCVQRKGSTASI